MTGGSPPPGTGPFKFKAWIPGQEYEVVRNDNYWGGAPYLDGIRFRVIIEATSRAAAVQAGDIDVTERLGPTFVQRIKSGGLKGMQFCIHRHGRNQTVGVEYPIGADLGPSGAQGYRAGPRQRRDHEGGYVWLRRSNADLGSGRYRLGNSRQLKWKRNIEEAKRLLKEAGYSGKPITLGSTQGQDDPWAEAVARQAAEAGIKFSIQNLAGAELIQKNGRG